MKLKKLLAAGLGLSMMFAVPAYANEADAVAVCQQMEEKSKEMNDTDAYYDYKIVMSDGTDSMDMRLEMNLKANHLQNPDQLKMNMYSRMTMGQIGGTAEGPAGDGALDLSGMTMTYNVYYENGIYYMDMMGQKIKYPVPLAEMMKQIENTTNLAGTELEYLKDMKLRVEGDDRIVSFTMDMAQLNGLLGQIMSMQGMQPAAGAEGVSISYRDVSGEYVVNPDGWCTKVRMKMTMDMTAAGETMTMTMNGDVGFANPGQPVEVPTPNLAEYQTMEQME